MTRCWWPAVFLSFVFGAPGLFAAQDDQVEVIRVRGLDTMAPRVERLANLYMEQNAGCRILVSGGRGQEGLRELLDRNTEIAMGAYSTSPEERDSASGKGIALAEQLIGWDGLAIVVHPANPVSELTLDQVRGIFTGAIDNWSAVGGAPGLIEVLVREGVRTGYDAYFRDFALKKTAETPKSTKKLLVSAILKEVALNRHAVGCAPLATVSSPPHQGSVKAAAIKKDTESPAVAPSDKTVADRSYPLIVPLLLYFDRNTASTHTKRFVEFCAAKGL